ncbi:DciA family protein [Halochromatium sp.]
MTKSAAHVRRFLRANQPIAALLDEIERREQLLSTVRQWLPVDLAKHCCQASLSADELTLFVDSPVWVDRFRFLCPGLIGSHSIPGLASLETEVKTCNVRVLPRASGSLTQPPAKRDQACVDPGSAPADDADANGLALSQALARLARTLGYPSG